MDATLERIHDGSISHVLISKDIRRYRIDKRHYRKWKLDTPFIIKEIWNKNIWLIPLWMPFHLGESGKSNLKLPGQIAKYISIPMV